MRVAIDARLVAYQRAGIANYTLNLLRAMRRQVSGESLLVLKSRKDDAIALELPDIPSRRLITPPHHRFEQLALALELSRLDADVLHSPDFIPPFFTLVPKVITVHDLAFLKSPEIVTDQSRRYYGQVRQAVRVARRVIAVSEATRHDLLDLTDAPAERVVVIHEAADPRFSPSPPNTVRQVQATFGLHRPYFLFVGTREPRKNLRRLIDAFARITDVEAKPDLVVAGRPGWIDDSAPSFAASLGVSDRVHWLEACSSEQLQALYSGAIAFVLPSLDEGFGLPVLEAMACGAPVIVSNAGALPEVAGNAALIVDPLDVEDIADGLRAVLNDVTLRHELIQRGRDRSMSFSWDRAASETLALYRQVA